MPNLTAILNLVYTARAHGSSDEDLAVITPSYWKKLKNRHSQVWNTWYDMELGDETRLFLEEAEGVADGIMDSLYLVFSEDGGFDYKELVDLADWWRDFPDVSSAFQHPAWKKFTAKILKELTNKLVHVVNSHKKFAQV